MDAQIALILLTDGVANGAIYVLIALGTVLIFSVTRVIFVPFGDIAALTALTVAAIGTGRLPGTVWLVALLAAAAVLMELAAVVRRRRFDVLPRVLMLYAGLPLLPVLLVVAVTAAGLKPPQLAQMLLAIALVLPVAPLVNRVVFEPLASASVLGAQGAACPVGQEAPAAAAPAAARRTSHRRARAAGSGSTEC
jgi:branched-chain amino acid transport system permease protein